VTDPPDAADVEALLVWDIAAHGQRTSQTGGDLRRDFQRRLYFDPARAPDKAFERDQPARGRPYRGENLVANAASTMNPTPKEFPSPSFTAPCSIGLSRNLFVRIVLVGHIHFLLRHAYAS
jgi:hypothetical protein